MRKPRPRRGRAGHQASRGRGAARRAGPKVTAPACPGRRMGGDPRASPGRAHPLGGAHGAREESGGGGGGSRWSRSLRATEPRPLPASPPLDNRSGGRACGRSGRRGGAGRGAGRAGSGARGAPRPGARGGAQEAGEAGRGRRRRREHADRRRDKGAAAGGGEQGAQPGLSPRPRP